MDYQGKSSRRTAQDQDDWDQVHNDWLDVQAKERDRSQPAVLPKNEAAEKEADTVAQQVTSGHAVDLGGMSGAGEQPTVVPKHAASEKQADEVAQKVSGGESVDLGGMAAGSSDDAIVQRKGEQDAPSPPGGFGSALRDSKSGGTSLNKDTQAELGSKMGADFGDVRVHTDAQAAGMADSIQARAFTHGQNIYFGEGEFNPGSAGGKELLAHELVHTVQNNDRIHRKDDPGTGADTHTYFSIFIDSETKKDTPELTNLYILMQIFQVSEAEVRSRISLNFTWSTGFSVLTKDYEGKWKKFGLSPTTIARFADIRPMEKRDASGRKEGGAGRDKAFKGMSGKMQHSINDEANKRFWAHKGIKPGEVISDENDPKGIKRQIWLDERDKLIEQYEKIQALPQNIKDVLFTPGEMNPADFEKILETAEKLKGLSNEELALLKAIRSPEIVSADQSAISVDMFIAQLPWVKRMRVAQETSLWKGFTDEQTIYRCLNRPADAVQTMSAIYNQKYYPLGDGNMVDDVRGELSGQEYELARVLMAKAGLIIPNEETPKWVGPSGSEGIFPQNPGLTTITPGTKTWYGVNDHCNSYQWGILYESGNTLVAVDDSIAYQPAREDQLDGKNMLKMKYSDWKFPGQHTVICRVEKQVGEKTEIRYYYYPQEVRGFEQDVNRIDVQYEIIAHDLAYRDYLDSNTKIDAALTGEDLTKAQTQKKQSKLGMSLMKSWGYSDKVSQQRDDASGFFAVVFYPQPNRLDLHPILAFRGTDDLQDAITDSDKKSPGYTQFIKNKPLIAKLIDEANAYSTDNHLEMKIDLTGHSLGGALCQWTATDPDFKGKFGRVITFQSPGISNDRVQNYNSWKKEDRPSYVTHHIAEQDIVPMAGEANIPGTFYTHQSQDFAPFLSHTHLLLQNEAFAAQRKSLGITDELLYALGFDAGNLPIDRNSVGKFDQFPFETARRNVEVLRKKLRQDIDDYIERARKRGEKLQKFEQQQVEAAKKFIELMEKMPVIMP